MCIDEECVTTTKTYQFSIHVSKLWLSIGHTCLDWPLEVNPIFLNPKPMYQRDFFNYNHGSQNSKLPHFIHSCDYFKSKTIQIYLLKNCWFFIGSLNFFLNKQGQRFLFCKNSQNLKIEGPLLLVFFWKVELEVSDKIKYPPNISKNINAQKYKLNSMEDLFVELK